MKCEVCSAEISDADAVVCSVPAVPYSACYCRVCLEANAHPWHILVANTAALGTLDDSALFWKEMVSDTCKHLGKTIADFEADVKNSVAAMEEYFANVETPEPTPINFDSED